MLQKRPDPAVKPWGITVQRQPKSWVRNWKNRRSWLDFCIQPSKICSIFFYIDYEIGEQVLCISHDWVGFSPCSWSWRVPQRPCRSAGPERRGREREGRASLVSEQEPWTPLDPAAPGFLLFCMLEIPPNSQGVGSRRGRGKWKWRSCCFERKHWEPCVVSSSRGHMRLRRASCLQPWLPWWGACAGPLLHTVFLCTPSRAESIWKRTAVLPCFWLSVILSFHYSSLSVAGPSLL